MVEGGGLRRKFSLYNFFSFLNESQWDFNLIIHQMETLNLNTPYSCYMRTNLFLFLGNLTPYLLPYVLHLFIYLGLLRTNLYLQKGVYG